MRVCKAASSGGTRFPSDTSKASASRAGAASLRNAANIASRHGGSCASRSTSASRTRLSPRYGNNKGSINDRVDGCVVVGAEDYRTPVSEAEQLYSALKLQHVPTMLIKVPGASHGGIAARPSQSAAKAAAIIAWFDKYRKREGTSQTAGN